MMLYLLGVLLLFIGVLIRRNAVQVPILENNKRGPKLVSNLLFWLAFILSGIELLSGIKIENENLAIGIRLLLVFALCFTIFYYCHRLSGNTFKFNVFNSLALIGSILLLTVLFFSLQQPRLTIEGDTLKITSFISPQAFQLSRIDSVVLTQKAIQVKHKVNGFDFSGIYRGTFAIDDSEHPCFLYLNESHATKLIIYLNNDTSILYTTAHTEELHALYQALHKE